MKVNNVEIGILNLSKIQDIITFIQIINKYEGNYMLQHDNVEVEAKSIMGIYSLNLEEDVSLVAKKAKASEIQKLTEALKEANLLKN